MAKAPSITDEFGFKHLFIAALGLIGFLLLLIAFAFILAGFNMVLQDARAEVQKILHGSSQQ